MEQIAIIVASLHYKMLVEPRDVGQHSCQSGTYRPDSHHTSGHALLTLHSRYGQIHLCLLHFHDVNDVAGRANQQYTLAQALHNRNWTVANVHTGSHAPLSFQSRSGRNIFWFERDRSVTGARAECDRQCECLQWNSLENIGPYREWSVCRA